MESRVGWSPFLVTSNVASWFALAFIFVSGFSSPERTRFTELETERLDIVGENGQPVLVLSNQRLMPGPRIDGKAYPPEIAEPRSVVSGMIFYNEEGDEVGGLIYNGFPKDTGHTAVGHLSFDQWKQNQVVALQYLDTPRTLRAGLRVWDRSTAVSVAEQLDRALAYRDASPEERDSLRRATAAARARGESGTERLFVGSQDRSAKIELRDRQGRVRARLVVDSLNAARLEFLDADGMVVHQVPEAE